MKKMIIFLGIIVVLLGSLTWLTSQQQTQEAEGNPFGKDQLHQSTIDQLDDPLYANVILPNEMDEILGNEENKTVYYYSPQCPACDDVTPMLVPLAEEENVDLQLFNVLEFPEGHYGYDIEGVPTVIHYEAGEEQERLEGGQEEDVYRSFFQSVVTE
ncbi:thioredoxin family protein [Texcoconibacillus texcoconensis]|uniref:Thiol-disulfide isomerase/thioredoxin n=1 Tax=Texcoconibacillus texcoconensis TaxID=1095777 RepID=A0A840QST2_9BACI|nr:thioredoxin family protein [Texcoconibacillus texcoconensis]MBB5174368.1 thiol-disulfide isomerase/thioredoxin [Texcoconibacillus texcoconensis]